MTGSWVSFDNMVCVLQTNRNRQIMGKGDRKIIHLVLVLWTNTAWGSLLAAVVPGNLFLQPGSAGLGSSAGSWENRLFYSSSGPLRVLPGCFKSQEQNYFCLYSEKKKKSWGWDFCISCQVGKMTLTACLVQQVQGNSLLDCSACLTVWVRRGIKPNQTDLKLSRVDASWFSNQQNQVPVQGSKKGRPLDGMKDQKISVTPYSASDCPCFIMQRAFKDFPTHR